MIAYAFDLPVDTGSNPTTRIQHLERLNASLQEKIKQVSGTKNRNEEYHHHRE